MRFYDLVTEALGENLRAFFRAGIDKLHHAVAMLAGDYRAHVRLLVAIRRADFDRLRSRD